jgi:ribosomal protein L22
MSFHGDYLVAPSLSKHFAEDLLRGAMDLRESLATLEKFQTASRSMRLYNMKRRPETGEKSPEIDTIIREVLLRPSNAKQALPRTVSSGLHGQLSNSTGELKNAVKDNFYRKNNLLSVSSNNEQASLSQSARYLPGNNLISKTSQQKKAAQRSFPSCAAVQPVKSKAPSLVAKLMGLDGLPSQKDNSKMKGEKIKTVSSPRARFDIEMPKSQRLQKQLFGEESGFDAEMPRSEKLATERYNVRTDCTSSQKGITPSYGTVATNEVRQTKSSRRERSIEQARPKSPKEIKIAAPASRKQQIKEATEINRRTREKQKSNLTSRNRGGREDAKTKASSASRTAKVVKSPDRKSASSSSRSCESVKRVLQKTHNNSRQKKASRRNVKNSTIDELVVRILVHRLTTMALNFPFQHCLLHHFN